MSAEFSLLHKFRSRKNRHTKRLFDAMMDGVNPELYEAKNGLTIPSDGLMKLLGKSAVVSYSDDSRYRQDYPYTLDQDRLADKLAKLPKLSIDQLEILYFYVASDVSPEYCEYAMYLLMGYSAFVALFLTQKDMCIDHWPIEPKDMLLEDHETINIREFIENLSKNASEEQPYLQAFLVGAAKNEFFDDQDASALDQYGDDVCTKLLMAGVGLATLQLEKHFELCTTEVREYQIKILSEMSQ